jgi:peptide/nickel transport system ATP-binding protein
VLDIRNLTVTYDTDCGPLHTVRDVSLHIAPGEIYGLVGESGSGKTTLARAAVRYLPANGRVTGGSVTLDGLNLLNLARDIRRSGEPGSPWCTRILCGINRRSSSESSC